MRTEHLHYLVCSTCTSDLLFSDETKIIDGIAESGFLVCKQCKKLYPIINRIPRFVSLDNYATAFGYQWNIHSRNGYDADTGTKVSENRFFEETKWSPNLSGETILEVGGGAGRFTNVAVTTNAMVISLDYSNAVEANYKSNGANNNLLIVQGDLYQMPFRRDFFDKAFCFGVVQHTPDVKKSFESLLNYLKPGGRLAFDIYARKRGIAAKIKEIISLRYRLRPLTKRMKKEKLYSFCRSYVNFMWPLGQWIGRSFKTGSAINHKILILDYRNQYKMSEDKLKEMAVCDLFDQLQPAYDSPQYLDIVTNWLQNSRMQDIEAHYGYNGIEVRGTKPL